MKKPAVPSIPRADAVLKNRTELHDAIWERLLPGPNKLKHHEIIAWLQAEHSLTVSTGAFSVFVSWLRLQKQAAANAAVTEGLLDAVKQAVPTVTQEQLDELGHTTFSLQAMEQGDLKGYVQLRSLRSREEIERAKLDLRLKTTREHALDALREEIKDRPESLRAFEAFVATLPEEKP